MVRGAWDNILGVMSGFLGVMVMEEGDVGNRMWSRPEYTTPRAW